MLAMLDKVLEIQPAGTAASRTKSRQNTRRALVVFNNGISYFFVFETLSWPYSALRSSERLFPTAPLANRLPTFTGPQSHKASVAPGHANHPIKPDYTSARARGTSSKSTMEASSSARQTRAASRRAAAGGAVPQGSSGLNVLLQVRPRTRAQSRLERQQADGGPAGGAGSLWSSGEQQQRQF